MVIIGCKVWMINRYVLLRVVRFFHPKYNVL